MGGVGLIETYRVGSVADKGNKYMYMFVAGNDIKRIKYHLYASCNIYVNANAISIQYRLSQVFM